MFLTSSSTQKFQKVIKFFPFVFATLSVAPPMAFSFPFAVFFSSVSSRSSLRPEGGPIATAL